MCSMTVFSGVYFRPISSESGVEGRVGFRPMLFDDGYHPTLETPKP